MEKVLEELKGASPKDVVESLVKKFNATPERAGKVLVQTKQILRWFSNKRQRCKGKCTMVSTTSNTEPLPLNDHPAKSAIANSDEVPSGRQPLDSSELEFEAKSSKDGAWYDVATFLTHRILESGEPEVRVRFAGFGAEEDEWVNVRKAVRQRSIPCEASDCVSIRPGDTVLCFREGIEQAIYFDACVIDVQRKRHDVRGCRCRFLIRYDHDKIEERVPLRRVYRRPEV
ncbi:protein SAWADEE HOMEODOMAIN HOMOLOG 2 isoform X2 [Cryptomeria japonica]|nr:protein SAWADEE HOMEODOMAIN HOMOLOG 2 isoform X2 [Cryptomeria japonica]